MKIKLNEYKLRTAFSSVLTLVPILIGIIIWDKIPNSLLPNSVISTQIQSPIYKIILVFGLPILLLILNLICLHITFHDSTSNSQSNKILNTLFYICPSISIIGSIAFYNGILENALNLTRFIPSIIGLMFIILGNNLPKAKPNVAYGIKIKWTLQNKENWAKTHKFAGYVWVICGVLLLFVPIVPLNLSVPIMIGILFWGIILPIIYSYCVYKKQLKNGTYLIDGVKAKGNSKFVMIPIIIILCFVFAMMFTGNIDSRLESNAISINATYYTDIKVPYKNIERIEYREYKNIGTKTNGFNSFKLSLGAFKNDEFKNYICYVYNNVSSCIAIKTSDGFILINAQDDASTKKLYNDLLYRIK